MEGIDNRNGWVDAVYLDINKSIRYSSTQETVETEACGQQEEILEWMQDYLKDREMRTVIKGATSSRRKVTSGVPQGSVLAPIMFQIYVNDMQYGVTSYMNMFADDTKLTSY